MKLLKLIRARTSYKLGFYTSKISGFMFFTANFESSKVKYQRRWIDFLLFFMSFALNVYLFGFAENFNMNFKIRSEILYVGTQFLYKVSLFTIICTKFNNFVRAKKAFGILRSFEIIDEKVRKCILKTMKISIYCIFI